MCGICGVVSTDPRERIEPSVIVGMRDTLVHRGPDDSGLHIAPGVGLGFRRLSIIDLRPEGCQPMTNEDESIYIVFNGEIYNFKPLRKMLIERGHRFRSRTDTEVILHLYEDLGVGCLRELRGMFAFAIWDSKRRLLFMARDRAGKKPLFYRFDGKRLLFGSEAKAILAFPGVEAEPDPDAINQYLGFGYVPAPFAAFKGLSKLPPAHFLVFSTGKIEVRRYWQLRYLPKIRIDEEEASREVIRRLREAVELRMISDVPLGAFLSGGIDSSAVVAMMSEFSSQPVKTFSIGFHEPQYDETPFARIVAKRFQTEHHEFMLEPIHAPEALDELVWHYNEPYADSSALPTYYLSKLSREYVTVALTGDAGDENFGGYRRYSVNLLSNWLGRSPAALRHLLGRAISGGYRQFFGKQSRMSDRIQELSEILTTDWQMGYARMLTQFGHEAKRQLFSQDFVAQVDEQASENLVLSLYREAGVKDPIDSTLYVDVNLYLPDDLLVKVDIASMAVGLEARSPMVDHLFMEFVASLPRRFKLSGLGRKLILRKALRRLLPPAIIDRPKRGFGVPLDYWFRGGLSDFIRDTLLSKRSLERGYFNPGYVRNLIDEHTNGIHNWHHHLWNLLMLELWHRKFIDAHAETSQASFSVPRLERADNFDEAESSRKPIAV